MEPPSSQSVTVLNETSKVVRKAILARAMSGVFTRHGILNAGACLLLTSDERVQELNRQFRGIDESTDVLTFPAGDFSGNQLGDVAISIPYAVRQAQKRKVSLTQELGYLAIHGALHLLGFDDQTESERKTMVREMNLSAVECGLKPDEEWASILHGETA